MSNPDDIPILERPSFYDGQRLTANDLSAVQAFHRELHWLHTRSLHGWGIALGFAVSGAKGDRLVHIAPGYAVDCNGRDLIQSEPLQMPIPAVAGASDGGPITYYLTAAYAEDSSLPAQTQLGTCGSQGAIRRPEQPIIRWQDPNDTSPDSRYRRGEDIILATIQVQNCQLLKDVSLAEQRNAVPAQQPYIYAGQTPAGQTQWRFYPDTEPHVGVVTTVSTGSAGFRNVPRYQANVVGDRLFQSEADEGDMSSQFFADGYAQVAAMTAGSFDLRVLLPRGATVGQSGVDFVNGADINLLFAAIVSRAPAAVGSDLFARLLSQRTFVGLTFVVFSFAGEFPFPISITIESSDFDGMLNAIAQRNSTTVDALLEANGFTRDTFSVQINDRLVIPGATLDLNPAELVFQDRFLDQLNADSGWSVVWMGIEG
jgi:hypothetical protein